jgi:hypothetical protein
VTIGLIFDELEMSEEKYSLEDSEESMDDSSGNDGVKLAQLESINNKTHEVFLNLIIINYPIY